MPGMGPAQTIHISVNKYSGKQNAPENDNTDSPGQERRRIGRIVHDDRGSASVEWCYAPRGEERQKLELEEDADSGRADSKLRGGLTLEVCNDDTFNPYDRTPDTFGGRVGPAGGGSKTGKRDLKKLSEWVKLMRAMEERKKNGDDEA